MVRSTESRIGYFDLPTRVLRQEPEKLRPVFNKVVVITAVNCNDTHRYLAYSDEFDWIPNGAPIPVYECGRHKNMTIYFKRKAIK